MRAFAVSLRRPVAFLATLAVAVLAAGPGPGSAARHALAAPAPPTAPLPQLSLVRFGSPQAISDAGVFIGRERGYFQALGIEVETIPFQSGPNLIVPLASGDLEVGGGTFSTGLLNAIDRGVGIKAVADKGSSRAGFNFVQLPVRRSLLESGEVRTIADLRGRRIAVASTRSGAEASTAQVLKQGGVRIDEVSLVELGYPDMLVAFGNGAIDAGIVIEPILTAALTNGVAVSWDPGYISTAFGGVYQAAMIFYSGRFASQTDLARRFMIGYIQGLRAYNDAFVKGEGRDEVVRILTENTAVKDPALYDVMNMAGLDPDGRITRQSLQIELDYFKERGYYTGSLTLDQVLDTSFVEYAVQQLGPYR
jgi:NitT/TauT family transport system substrate-binding protein